MKKEQTEICSFGKTPSKLPEGQRHAAKANSSVSRAERTSHKGKLGHAELGTAVGDERELFFLPDALT